MSSVPGYNPSTAYTGNVYNPANYGGFVGGGEEALSPSQTRSSMGSTELSSRRAGGSSSHSSSSPVYVTGISPSFSSTVDAEVRSSPVQPHRFYGSRSSLSSPLSL